MCDKNYESYVSHISTKHHLRSSHEDHYRGWYNEIDRVAADLEEEEKASAGD